MSRGKLNIPVGAGFLMVGIGLVAFIVLSNRFSFTQDDAFITFRYAANFLNGDGLVYNIGERVEGYTNFLWLLWVVLGELAGVDPAVCSKYLGLLFGSATIAIVYLMTLDLFSGIKRGTVHLMAGTCALLLGLTYSFAYWSTAGLETAAFSFFLLSSIYLYARRRYLVAPVMVMAVLLRPEGGLIFLFMVAFELITRRKITQYLSILAILTAVFMVPYAVFKLVYYGSLIPNTFYAKTNFNMDQLTGGLAYTGRYFGHYLAAGAFLLPALISFRRTSPGMKILMMFSLVYIFYIIIVGGDVLKVHRFFVPLMPLLIMVLVSGIFLLLRRIWMAGLAVAVVLAWQMFVPYSYVSTFHQRELQLADKMNTMMVMLKAADGSKFSIAASTIGLVGYRLVGHEVVDLLGLTDTTIARHPEPPVAGMESSWRESHFNSRYILERRPDYILFSTGRKPSAPAERALFLYSGFLKSYRTVSFYYNGGMNAIYKNYFAVEGEIMPDVDVRFVQFLNKAINFQNDGGNYQAALAYLDSASAYCTVANWPYINFYRAISWNQLGEMEKSLGAMRSVVEMDTLAVEGFINLCRYESHVGNWEAAREYYNKALELSPWQKSLLNKYFDPARP